MGVGGVVGLSAAANVFVGMVEAPLFVRPYLARVSRGELFAIMAGGMASIAGTVLFLYGSILRPVVPGRGGAPAHRLDPLRARGAGDCLPDGSARTCHRRRKNRARERRLRQHGRAHAGHAARARSCC